MGGTRAPGLQTEDRRGYSRVNKGALTVACPGAHHSTQLPRSRLGADVPGLRNAQGAARGAGQLPPQVGAQTEPAVLRRMRLICCCGHGLTASVSGSLFKGARGQSDGEALQLGSLTGLSGSQVSAEIPNRSCLWDGGQCPSWRSTQDGGARTLPTCGCRGHQAEWEASAGAHQLCERGWLVSRVPGVPHRDYTRVYMCDHLEQCLAGVPDECNYWY